MFSSGFRSTGVQVPVIEGQTLRDRERKEIKVMDTNISRRANSVWAYWCLLFAVFNLLLSDIRIPSTKAGIIRSPIQPPTNTTTTTTAPPPLRHYGQCKYVTPSLLATQVPTILTLCSSLGDGGRCTVWIESRRRHSSCVCICQKVDCCLSHTFPPRKHSRCLHGTSQNQQRL